MSNNAIADLTSELDSLDIRHSAELKLLTDRHRSEKQRLLRRFSSSPIRSKRPTSALPVDFTGHPLHVNDIVSIRTSAKTGKIGDSARIVHYKRNSSVIHIQLLGSTSRTTRLSKNLDYVE